MKLVIYIIQTVNEWLQSFFRDINYIFKKLNVAIIFEGIINANFFFCIIPNKTCNTSSSSNNDLFNI